MSTGAAWVTYTPAEYLELERAAERKSEYLHGQIRAMTGASRAHNVIALNIGRELSTQLRGRPCEAYVADMRVKVSQSGLYTYPDVVMACEPIQLEDAYFDTLLNPTVIFEVLSPSTEAYDRGEKLAHYRRLESLREYLLVAQDSMRVERLVHQGGAWARTEYVALDEVVPIEAIDCSLKLRDIYERVSLPQRSAPAT